MKKIYILDGFGLIFRSYFAFMRSPLYSPDGRNVSAIFGFYRTLFSLFDSYNIKNFVVALDSKDPTFRKQLYNDYKANREAAPDDLVDQIPTILEILKELKIPSIEASGYEADDVIATLCRQIETDGDTGFIISSDKDLMQLVNDNIYMLRSSKSGGFEQIDAGGVVEDKGVNPDQILDLLALMGDSADNIPGVKGVGPKTASKLLAEHTTLEGIYENIDSVKGKMKEKLLEGRDSAYLSRQLAELKFDVPVSYDSSIDFELHNKGAVAKKFLDMGMKSLAEYLGSEEVPTVQGGLSSEKGEYQLILTKQELESFLSELRSVDLLSLDVETDNIDAMSAHPVGLCFSIQSKTGYYLPFKAPDTECLREDFVKRMLKNALNREDLRIIGQNIKYDYKVLKRWGLELEHLYFDTMIAAWLLDSTRNSFSMDSLAEDFLGYKTVHFKDLLPKGGTFDEVPLDKALEYAAEDADITLRLYEYLEPELRKNGFWELFEQLEMPLVKMLGDMEYRGIQLDADQLSTFRFELETELVKIEEEIYKLCGKEFNIKSTQQLQTILFEERGLKPIKKTKTGYSTDSSVLEELAKEDPVPERILRHRMLSKLKSTYVDTLPELINRDTNRVHTHFIQTGTATGRLSSKDPNLQNIPIKELEGRRIRQAFVPKEGYKFISADYSQIELVVLAHLSGDEALSEAFKTGEDIHSRTASLIFDVVPELVAPGQRRIAKTINFGVMYGMSAFRLSRELGIPRKDADKFINSYFETYNKIKDFISITVKEGEQQGGVRTMLGHYRKLAGINSRNKTEKNSAERIAINTPIQGSAADIVKTAMLKLDSNLKSSGYDAQILLQVHDELILECVDSDVDKVSQLVKDTMESAITLSIPLRATVENGTSWGELH
ncbi:DNA polymerase I [Spirochaeta cellobiosiphila]|uniref:DNA polymerase I n=1 Tax=Spirochaeta cellobiosiphila TaxID=504483 RepID=UPI00041DD1F2|nr:DNA polymerase I [Spirochaeta cellobiosiphila]